MKKVNKTKMLKNLTNARRTREKRSGISRPDCGGRKTDFLKNFTLIFSRRTPRGKHLMYYVCRHQFNLSLFVKNTEGVN